MTATSYTYAVCGVPDLDQVRAAGPGVGLPGDGYLFCAPTAAMDFLARLSADGYLTAPGSSDWTDPKNYNAMSAAIAELGADMGTIPSNPGGGTSGDGALSGLQQYIAAHRVGSTSSVHIGPGVNYVFRSFFSQAVVPGTPASFFAPDLANMAIAGSYVVTDYGFYKNVLGPDGKPAYARYGGHAVALVAASGYPGSGYATLTVNNPATPYPSPPTHTQSAYDTDTLTTFDQGLLKTGWIDPMNVTHFYPNPAALSRITDLGSTSLGDSSFFIDGAVTLSPEQVVTSVGRTIRFYTPFSLVPRVSPPQPVWSVPGHGPIEAFASPTVGVQVPFVEGGTNSVLQLNQLTGAVSVLARGVTGARTLSFAGGTTLYVGGARGIIALDRQGHQIAALRTPSAVDALSFDSQSRQIIALSTGSRRLLLLTSQLKAVAGRTLTQAALAGRGTPFIAVSASGALVVHRDGSSSLASTRLAARAAANGRSGIPPLSTHRLQLAGTPHGFAVDDAGNEFVSVRGRLVELSPRGVPIQGSPFTGRPAGSMISVTRSSTNYSAVPGQPSIDYVPPALRGTTAFAPVAP